MGATIFWHGMGNFHSVNSVNFLQFGIHAQKFSANQLCIVYIGLKFALHA